MRKLRVLLFLMLAVVVGGVYATFTYYEVQETTIELSIGIDAVLDPEVYNIIDISVTHGENCAFYTYDDNNNNAIFDYLGMVNVSGNWNIDEEQLENYVGKEIVAAYVKITAISGVNNFVYGEADIEPLQYSTEEHFIGNVAFGEDGGLFMPEENPNRYALMFELQSIFSDEIIKLNDAIPTLETYDMYQAFANCFDGGVVDVEFIFKPLKRL